jgi:diketogulonate reductase-like aldo/keto reductase
VSYVDLLLVHWPSTEQVPLAETMEALANAKRAGKTRHVGVANFNIALLEEAIRLCPEPLVTLQAEYHPYLDQSKVLAYCRSHGLVFMAYCPLARGRMFKDPVLGEIARDKGKSIAQIALRWLVQQEIVAPIPRSANPAHMAESLGRVRLHAERRRDEENRLRSGGLTAGSPTGGTRAAVGLTAAHADGLHARSNRKGREGRKGNPSMQK